MILYFKLFFWYQKLKQKLQQWKTKVKCPHCHKRIHYMISGTPQYSFIVCPECKDLTIRYHLIGYLPKYRTYAGIFV